MSHRIRCYGAAALAALGFCPVECLLAQETPVRSAVQVEFRIEAARYVDHFGIDRTTVEGQAAKRFAKEFGDRFGFLDFTTETQPVKLRVILANVSPSQNCSLADSNCPKETVLRLVLEQPGASPATYDSWTYLKREEFFVPLGGTDEEVENLGRVGFAKLKPGDITARLLSRVPLTSTGHLIWKRSDENPASTEQLAGVAIPLPAMALCADQHSVLVLRSEIPQQFTQPSRAELAIDAQGPFLPPENPPDEVWNTQRGNLFGIPAADPPRDRKWDKWDSLLAVTDRKQIKITGISMYQYRRMDTGCSAAIPPSALVQGDSQ